MTASRVDDNSDSAYHAFADVTSRVAAAGGGVYAVGDVQAATGADRYAGWALVVAYHDDDAPTRNLTIFDGYQPIASNPSIGPSSADITVDGFQTPPAPARVTTRVGAVSYEGDLGLFGDSMQLNGIDLANAVNPADNFFNSTIADGTTQTTAGRSPSQLNHFGFDADLLAAPAGSMPNSASQATLRVATASAGGETFYPGVLTFATDLFAPKLRPVTTVTDVNGGNVEPGDLLRYTTTGTNVGTDTAANVTVTHDVPAEFELLEGTLKITDGAAAGPQTAAGGDDRATWDPDSRELTWRLGTGGASVISTGGAIGVNETFTFTYDVRVGAPPNGERRGGPATSEYVGQSTTYPFKLTGTGGSVSVAGPDLAMDLTRTGDLVRGDTATYSLSVKNVGAASTAGPVQVVDELPAGLELAGTAAGNGWTCEAVGRRVSCDRADVLAIDESYPSITIPVRVRQNADSSLANAATVSGGSDGVHTNDTDADTATVVSKSDLEVEQSHGTPPDHRRHARRVHDPGHQRRPVRRQRRHHHPAHPGSTDRRDRRAALRHGDVRDRRRRGALHHPGPRRRRTSRARPLRPRPVVRRRRAAVPDRNRQRRRNRPRPGRQRGDRPRHRDRRQRPRRHRDGPDDDDPSPASRPRCN